MGLEPTEWARMSHADFPGERSALNVGTIGLKDENLEISGLISSLYNEARKQG